MLLIRSFWITWFLSVNRTGAFIGGSSSSHVANSLLSKQKLYHDTSSSFSRLAAKPRRLEDNIDGVVYVNDKCINCAACSGFAPDSFSLNGRHHVVHRQPQTETEIQRAREALAACPVAAIRVETRKEKKKVSQSDNVPWSEEDQDLVERMSGKAIKTNTDKKATPLFPRPFLDSVPDVYWLGHHNSASFGAIPYLFKSMNENGDPTWIMVDTPKFSSSAVTAVTSLTGPQGPDYLLLTHVDDTADHQKWADHFAPTLKRIFHSGDLGKHNWLNDQSLEDVEILLENHDVPPSGGLTAYSLDGQTLDTSEWWKGSGSKSSGEDTSLPAAIILHTPGHSPGSICLYAPRAGVLFTGDTYAYTVRTSNMTGFPRYGNDRKLQASILPRLLQLDWDLVAPGHGHARDYRNEDTENSSVQEDELQHAVRELQQW